jgi:hypothetical protein
MLSRGKAVAKRGGHGGSTRSSNENNEDMDIIEQKDNKEVTDLIDNNNNNKNNNNNNNKVRPLDLIKFKDLLQIVRELPKWSKDSICHEFLRNLKVKLLNSGLPEYEWVRILPHLFPEDVNKGEWINTNIDYKVHSWKDACEIFEDHFQDMDYHEQVKTKFENCKQAKGSLVQAYADEFGLLCHKLNYQDDNPIVIDRFIKGLNPGMVRSFYDHVTKVPTAVTKVKGAFSSLLEVMTVCMSLDVAYRTAQHAIGELTGRKSELNVKPSLKSNSNSENIKKFCPQCPHLNNHTLEECRKMKKRSALGLPISKRTNKNEIIKRPRTQPAEIQNRNIVCYNCNEVGHIAPNCPNKKGIGTPKPFNNLIAPPSYNNISTPKPNPLPTGSTNQNINNNSTTPVNNSNLILKRQIRMLRKEVRKYKKTSEVENSNNSNTNNNST